MNCKRGHPLPEGAHLCPTCGEGVASAPSVADTPDAVVDPSSVPAATQKQGAYQIYKGTTAATVGAILFWGVLVLHQALTWGIAQAVPHVLWEATGASISFFIVAWLFVLVGKMRLTWGRLFIIWAIVTAASMTAFPAAPSISRAPESSQSGTEDDYAIATAQASTEKALAIVQQVLTGGKIVDQQTHDLFWSLIRSSGVSTPEASRVLVSGMTESLRVQNEFWKSMRLSAHAHRIVTTQGFEDAMKKVSIQYPNVNTVQEKQKAMLQAAAVGVPYSLPNGKGSVVFTEHYAEQLLAIMDATNAQVDKLLDPTWHP